MEVYLLRHGIAVEQGTEGYSEAERPLTPDGIEKMTRAARGIAELVPEFDLILTSPLVRARETAQLAAEATKSADSIKVATGLLPGSAMRDTYALLQDHRAYRRVLLVGHEPHLSSFATYLLGGSSSVVEFKKGALCRIDIAATATRQPGLLIYHLPPKVLRALGGKHHHQA